MCMYHESVCEEAAFSCAQEWRHRHILCKIIVLLVSDLLQGNSTIQHKIINNKYIYNNLFFNSSHEKEIAVLNQNHRQRRLSIWPLKVKRSKLYECEKNSGAGSGFSEGPRLSMEHKHITTADFNRALLHFDVCIIPNCCLRRCTAETAAAQMLSM